MNTISVDYKNQVLEILKAIPDGEERPLKKEKPKYHDFVLAVKTIIDWGEDWKNGFTIDFNSEFTKIKKTNRA